ncbi:PucR C-terminal helix-turn-helix domain-containing protein [Arthrobacter subterraneus]|uniref:PucR C-terminal helix-turn-helix domain-containing protein n=1 Tax=Arthrobacter subterraneus TaxID=335973 RepID=A0A1G8J8E8_9MICC|nr:helix-turn-helix domain-containing protein [Arthrobacter subterraneus]SDI27524.1 PucR C-terminal helix-turn-helix domain-containing protein [Arthrobacter subterraneus]
MFDQLGAGEIVGKAVHSVSALGFCHVAASYLVVDGHLVPSPNRAPTVWDDDVSSLERRDAPLPGTRPAWRYALSIFGDSGELNGCLVLYAGTVPTPAQMIKLRATVQTTVSNAAEQTAEPDLQEHAHLLSSASASDIANRLRILAATVMQLETRTSIQNTLDSTLTATLGQMTSRNSLLAEVLSVVTGRPVCIEDGFGNISATAGTKPGRPYPRPSAADRSRTAQLWLASGLPVQEPRRLVALVLADRDVLGAICLLENGVPYTANDVFALQYGTRLLQVELSHRRSMAQLELKLGRDLVDELVSGMDEETAAVRAGALGYDITGPQHVIAAQWQPPRTGDSVVVALRRTLRELHAPALVSRRSDITLAVVTGEPLDAELFTVAARTLRSATGAVGIGGPSRDVAQLPRSFAEALRALQVRVHSVEPYGLTRYDQLGIYRILGMPGSETDLSSYVEEWLGALQSNDARRGSELVHTLAQYLDHGGNYDDTAYSLAIHRSTLRYRLKCIRQITGFELGDPETRLNLHVATRAWRLRYALKD